MHQDLGTSLRNKSLNLGCILTKDLSVESYIERIQTYNSSLWQDKGPLLRHLDMEITERCNNDCIHCCINLPADDCNAIRKELATEKIKEILTEAAALGCLTVRVTGGEPLLRKDFKDVYVFARKLGLKVLLFTNATLVTPDLAQLLARMPPLEKIEITVYGMKKSSYESVTRTPGSFDAAWRGINLLLENKVPFVVKSAVLPSNKREIDQFWTWASSLPWQGRPSSLSMFFDLRCRRDSEKKNRRIKDLRLSPESGLNILTREREEYFEGMKAFCSKFAAPPGNQLFTCGSGTSGGCVDAYGYFQPCMLLRHPGTVYDLNKGSLNEALTIFFPKMRKMTAESLEYRYRCARCFLKSLCEQCPARSWIEYGNLDTPVEYFCEITHAQAIYLGIIKKGEKAWEIKDWKKRIKNFSDKAPSGQEIEQGIRAVCHL
jgi:radical SAM protein with 4Fe4S-binding SPASM domain